MLLCAADTFRAAAIEQLEIWGQRTGHRSYSYESRAATRAAVLFDALEAANARHIDCLIVDTAGRLAHQDEPDVRTGKDATYRATTDYRRTA